MITKLIILSISIFALARFLPGIKLKKPYTAIIVALVYTLVNYTVGAVLSFMALPLLFLTLGLFTFVINAFLLWLTDKLLEDFEIDNIKTTVIAAACITVVSTLSNWIL